MKKQTLRRALCILLALSLLCVLAACGEDEAQEPAQQPEPAGEPAQQPEEAPAAETAAQTEGWSIYWYLCGSDLESGGGFASGDLAELMEVSLPENVNVVIQTGGSSEWHNDFVDASKLQRFVYNSEGLFLVDEQPSASMGQAQTLAEFLAFARESYPAEHTAVVFWNHGGGSVSGAAFDELYGLDSLTLDEMYEAFTAVWTPDAEQQPLDLVGFDTCLMATVDVADTFSELAEYLVASEETEPANGWYYSQWVGELARNPAMDARTLGQTICDAYYAGCEAVGTQDSATLSVTDLSRVRTLLEAYEDFGAEALTAVCENPGFFSDFGRAALRSENYGGNTKEQGYTNMVDLGHLARQSGDLLSSSQAVLDALEQCVVYRVNGPYRAEASGLSCYYSYNGDVDDFIGYAGLGAGSAFKYFFCYELTGELDEGGMAYLEQLDIPQLPERQTLSVTQWDGAGLDVDAEGTAFLTLGPDAADVLTEIGFTLSYVDEQNDVRLLLGTDNDMNADWENGVFSDNFRGVWGSIDGSLVYMELSFEGDNYNLYSVPVLLNGEACNLQVVYDFESEQWTILGAREGIDASGMAAKELRVLQEGDELSLIWYMASASGEDEPEAYIADTLTVTPQTAFYESALPDGDYAMVFQMRDAMGNYAESDLVTFTCSEGEILTTVYE